MLNGIMPSWCATLLECVLVGVGLLLVYAVLALFYILYERKICAWFQCRLGPNRVGPWGLFQAFADMFKMLIKEIIELKNIDRFLFALAPYLVIIASMLCFAVLPWATACRLSTSISASSSSSPALRSACSAFCWPDGRPTTSSLLSALSVRARRW